MANDSQNIQPTSKDRLLTGATAWLLENSVKEFTLRAVAKDLGTSARMLVYHFGSKDGLLAAVLDEIASRWMGEVTFSPDEALSDQLRRLWTQHLITPEAQSLHVLTLQLWAGGLASRDPLYAPFLKTLSQGWTRALATHFVAEGYEDQEAMARAMLCVASIEGLLLHYVTDPTLPADAAFEHLMDLIERWRQV